MSKQQELDSNPKPILQKNFTGNLDRNAGATIVFIVEEIQENFLYF